MGIVLNEYEWAERMIENRELGAKPVETLTRISKYYFENQYSKKEVRVMLDKFLIQCDPSVALARWSDTLDKITKSAAKYPLVKLDGVVVSYRELQRIEALEGMQIRRLAFTLLCVSKYWDAVSSRNNHWVNSSDVEIMRMANIGTSVKRQSAMFGQLRANGLIRFSKKIDNLNVQVLFSDSNIPEPEVAIHIRDFRNIGFQYLKHYGGPYFECENCGVVTKIADPNKGRKPKYCAGCAAEVKTRQNVNSVMRHRNLLKS